MSLSAPLFDNGSFSREEAHSGFHRFGRGLFAWLVFFAAIVFVEPSPYDVLALLTVFYWSLLGLQASRHLLPVFFLILMYNLGGFISLLPHLDETDPLVFMTQSFYLGITTLFFAAFCSQHTNRRVDLLLKAYTAGCVVASIAGIMGYFDFAGTGDLFSRYTRASGTFKDPNVFGSFLVVGVLFLMQRLILGKTRRPVWSAIWLVVILVGVLLSFSRGSWGGTVLSLALMVGMAFSTTTSQTTRTRIVRLGLVTLLAGMVALASVLSIPKVRDLFTERASVTQDYDEGETGRFGNQKRSIPYLLEHPNGYGPVRFRLYFGLEPHNSYINAFASYGWLGGFAFIGIVLVTSFIGFRLCLTPSPFQSQAQVVWPSLLMYFFQAFQIDIDHWRHVYIVLGVVWGLEAARRLWQSQQENTPRNENTCIASSGPTSYKAAVSERSAARLAH